MTGMRVADEGVRMLRLASSTDAAADVSVTDGVVCRRGVVVSWRKAAVLVVVCAAVCGLAVALAGGFFAGSRVAVVSSRAMVREQVALVRARRQLAARERWLGGPVARAQRVASQMAFHGLGASAAAGLLGRDFASVLAADGAAPSVSDVTKAPVLRYLGPFQAEVRGPTGIQYVHSLLPLAHSVDGRERPVDLRLENRAAGFVPVNAAAGLLIGHDVADGVVLRSDGVRVAMEGRDVSGVPMGISGVFYGEVGRDLDATVTPTASGVELFAALRSRLSPEKLRFRFSLPSGAMLRSADGEVEIWRKGRVLARVSQPSAFDAQGQDVPVRTAIVGDQLVLRVERRAGHFAYPILVDPKINEEAEAAGWSFQQGHETEEGKFTVSAEGPFVAIGPGGIEAPSGHKYTWEETGRPTARWVWQAPEGEVITNVSFSFLEYFSPETAQSDYGEVEAGCGGDPTYIGFGSNSFSTLERSPPCSPTETDTLYVQYYARYETPPSTGFLAVDPIVVTEATRSASEDYGAKNKAEPDISRVNCGRSVNCAIGNEFNSHTDLELGGNPGLNLTRTYNSQLAAAETSRMFGYGWTASYGSYLTTEAINCQADAGSKGGIKSDISCSSVHAIVHQENGSTVAFEEGGGYGGGWVAGPWVQATLFQRENGEYEYTLPGGSKITFSKTGRELSQTDANGNTTTLTYNESGQLTKAEEPAKRTITFAYNTEGFVKEATDALGTVKYTYATGNLTEVTDLNKHVWKYGYGEAHQMTSETDPLNHTVSREYDSSHRVIKEEDALKRKRTWKYTTSGTGVETTVTQPNGAVTVEQFNAAHLPTSTTNASGTAIAATTTYEYDPYNLLVAVTDPDKHTTKYGYDAAGDRTNETNPDEDKREWTYDKLHEVLTSTAPNGEKTTIKRGAHEHPETISRPAPSEQTQTTTYKYDSRGDLESVTNPLEHTWTYEYDHFGDRTAEIDPEGNKRTWEYNEGSQEIAEVSPRGNAAGAEASKYTTKVERDTEGRPLKITDPLGHTTKYAYDGAGNIETMTDGNSHTTTYTYNSDNELTKVKELNGDVTETEYDAMGQVTSQTDGDKHVTKYVRNLLEEVEEVVNPLGQKTLEEHNGVGDVVKLTDAAKRTTTYTYDPANRLTEVSYSSGKPATIKYEYNKNGDRTKMTDGTGTSTYTYDQLDRMTESESGHKAVVKYKYDLANDQTEITYPDGKAVTRAFDKDDRLEKATDWSSNVTKFAYNPDSQLATTVFPTASKDEDTYAYNEADQLTEIKMKKGTETLASLSYTRDNDGQVKSTTAKGLPGTETVEDTYDEDNRLTKAGTTEYKYDAANNPTTNGASTNTFNEGDELTKSATASYAYNEVGQRTKTTPTSGPATTYGYDQAGNLVTVERPKEGETQKIEQSYAYNGEGLRASETLTGSTRYLTWQTAGVELPAILTNENSSIIYGPASVPIEQISSGGTVTYLHHDQQGSTRLLTGSTGKTEATFTYSPYGELTGHTGTMGTLLGFDGQYASSDTGLIYMRARVYDPATAQFLTVDPLAGITRAPYNYAGDNPVNESDPTGLSGVFGTGIGPNIGPDINWSEEGFWSTAEHVTLGVAGVGDTLATGITTAIATPICFAGVSAAPVIGQIAGYPACATFAAGGAAFTAYEAYETYWEWEQAFKGSGPAKSPKETADTCQPAEQPPLVSGF
jgi:RHS repeat-associated protein